MADYPLDHFAVKKIRANIIDGNFEQARGYYFLEGWVLKAIVENNLFPDAQPDICSRCKKGVIVMSIGGCQACYHCSNKDCDNRGCSNGVIPGAQGVTKLVGSAEVIDKKDQQIAEQSRLIQELTRRLTCEHCGEGLDEGPGPGCIDDHPAFSKGSDNDK